MPNPAPNDLALIEDFVNTFDLETGEEELASPEALTAWLAERGLADEPLGHDDLASAVALREHLRALLLANNGGELDPSVPAALSAAAERARLTVALDEHGRATVTPQAQGIDRARRPAARDRRPRPGRRHVGAAEGVPVAHLPLRVLRPLPQPLADVVRHGRVRQPRQGADVPPRSRLGGLLGALDHVAEGFEHLAVRGFLGAHPGQQLDLDAVEQVGDQRRGRPRR